MLAFRVEIKRARLREKLKALPEDMRKSYKKSLREAVMAVRRDARELVPERTKELRRSIRFKVAKDGLSAIVRPTAYYGGFVEHGTESMEAQPYMRPAAEAERKRFPGRISADLRAALKEYR